MCTSPQFKHQKKDHYKATATTTDVTNHLSLSGPHVASSYRLTNMLPSAPDMSQLKLGVRSAAGRLSVMASGVVTSLQVCGSDGPVGWC